MTVAAMAAEVLGESLARTNGNLDGMAQRFQQQYPKIVEPAWMLATSADIEWLGNQERPTPVECVTNWYVPKVLDTLAENRLVYETFLDVQNLVEPPTASFDQSSLPACCATGCQLPNHERSAAIFFTDNDERRGATAKISAADTWVLL